MQWIRRARGRPPHPDVLTPAEWRVLKELRLGTTNPDIAERLGVSVNTVRSHVSSMLAKLEVPDRHALASWHGEPAEETQQHLQRFGLGAPWWRFAGLTGTIVAVIALSWVALQAARPPASQGASLPAAAATPEPTEPASSPVAQTDVPPLGDLYEPKAYLPPDYGIGQRPVPSRFPPPTIEAADEEPETFLADDWPQPPDFGVFATAPGSRERECVDTTPIAGPVARSGDFVLDTSEWSAPPHRFALTAHESTERLFLRAIPIDGLDQAQPTTLIHEYQRDWNLLEGHFSPSFVLPEEGRWLVVANAGPQWGCFILDAPEPPAAYGLITSVSEAEQTGATYPSSPPPDRVTARFDGSGTYEVPDGSSARSCIDTDGLSIVRSGEWLLWGANFLFNGDPNAPSNRVFLIPVTQPVDYDEMERWEDTPLLGLRLTASFVDAPQHTYVYEAPRPNAYTPYDGDDEDGFEFQHITQPVLPRAGDWIVTVTDGHGGSQWSCFLSPGASPRP